uniref:Putative 5.3 kDa protein n=1 Tax=Ixodes ricinus TaxID=34613 RepID=A0A0K8RF76_IXORI
MAQKLTLIMFVLFGLLAISTFYVVESDRMTGPRYSDPPGCRVPCDGPNECRPPCSKCPSSIWGTQVCSRQ